MQLTLDQMPPRAPRRPPLVFSAKEWKLVALHDFPLPEGSRLIDTPDAVANYFRAHVRQSAMFRDGVENFIVILVNTRRRALGHYVVSTGTLDTLLVHPREVFRAAVIASAAAIVLLHNLCAATHKLCYVKCRLMCST